MLTTRLKPMSVEPTLTARYVMRDATTSEYLHMAGDRLTTKSHYRWQGTLAQATALRLKSEIARSLTIFQIAK